MSNSLLERLIAAQTDEERSWIVMENLLESLPEDVARALWAVAIPHWFDGEILAALCPELADRANELYRQLQDLSCVEVFPERGHNVHELTRNQLLDRLWQDKPELFRSFSGKAAEYFAKVNSLKNQIECIYHLTVADPTVGINYLSNLAQRWDSNYLRAELESLIVNLQQQISAVPTKLSLPNISSNISPSKPFPEAFTEATEEPIETFEAEPIVAISESRLERPNKRVIRTKVIEPPEVIVVEMTEEEQDVYSQIGISPLVLIDHEPKDPRNVIVQVALPDQEPRAANALTPKNGVDAQNFDRKFGFVDAEVNENDVVETSIANDGNTDLDKDAKAEIRETYKEFVPIQSPEASRRKRSSASS